MGDTVLCGSCMQPYDGPPGKRQDQWGSKPCRFPGRHRCGARHGQGLVERCELTRDECRRKRAKERQAHKAEAWATDPSSAPIDAGHVLTALEAWHNGGATRGAGWAMFREFRCATGWKESRGPRAGDTAGLVNPEARVDLYVVNLWPSKGCRLIAYEVKVSRADFLAEIRNPDKRAQAWAISTEYTFVTPQGLVKPDEVPDECGLYEVRYGKRGASYIERVVEPRRRDVPAIHWRTFASLAARVKEVA